MNEPEEFMRHYSLKLNEQQLKAVSRIDGATLLLAVPGSGKTTVIICRIAYMIKKLNISPASILTLTFSRMGARDLNVRYKRIFGDEEANGLRFSTIHSFSLSVIRNYERLFKRKAFEIIENPGMILKDIFIQLFEKYPAENDIVDIISAISYCKNMLLPEAEIEEMEVGDINFWKIYKAYEAYKREQHLMDFDDMLKYAWILMKKNPALLKIFTDQYRYINIDEAQDTSKIQYEVIHLVAKESGNIFMVGDEDQSIYGFRGAYPEGLLSFKDSYPEGEVLLIETNHRSTQEIVKAANRFITLNKERYIKNMRTENETGVPAVHEYVKSVEDQYHFILRSVKNEGKETAVLYRNNESVIPLVDLFEREGVPYNVKEHNPLFFTHFIVQDIRCFSALSENPSDYKAFEKIYYKINCNISRKNLKAVEKKQKPGENVFDVLLSLADTPDWLVDKVDAIRSAFKRLKTMKADAAITYIENHMGYREHLAYRVVCRYREEQLNQKMDIIHTLAAREETLVDLFLHLDHLEVALREKKNDRKADVTFSTIHSSKGLEFEKVFIIDAVEGEFPSMTAMEKNEKDEKLFGEEVRLFYVGVTRAKKELEFISVGKKNSTRNKRPVSQFVKIFMGEKCSENKKKIAKPIAGKKSQKGLGHFDVSIIRQRHASGDVDYSNYTEGKAVIHKGFGPGIITEVNDAVVTIRFENGGFKKLNLDICVLNGILSIK